MEKYISSYTNSYLKKQDKGESYDRKIGSKFELFIWDLEKKMLREIFSEIFSSQNNEAIEYLDFACGTGRVISFLKNELGFKNALGIDTSEAMISEAKKKVSAEFICSNIVEHPEDLDGRKFDLITSFRLFLNIEKENREVILKELFKYLKDDGYLIINNHVNRYSLIGIQFWIRRLIGNKQIINTATKKEFCELLEKAGFNVLKVYKFTLIPGRKNILMLPKKFLLNLELFLSRIPWIRNLGLSQIYICQKRK